jgi:RNA polymerase sigma-70 factor (ECF subfamily)
MGAVRAPSTRSGVVTTHHTPPAGSSRPGSRSPHDATSAAADAPANGEREGVTNGDQSGLRESVDKHAAVLFRVAVSIVRDPALADDIVQETFIKAWRFAPRDANGEIPRGWLTKVARNTAISALRSRREDPVRDDDLADTASGPSTARTVEGRAQLGELQVALDALDDDERILIVLREVDGLSYDEIAVSLGLPLSTVKTRLFRARQQLKSALGGWR